MLLTRTEKAQMELRPGVRTLTQKQRGVLLLADGRKSLLDMRTVFDGEAEQIALDLIREGYLEVRQPAPPPRAAPAPAPPPSPIAVRTPPAPVAADRFEGKRSLATTRMFLFDLCERMFARRDPVQAERFREMLRRSRDRASMLAASREILAEVERVAGGERADSIGERIAMLLPDADDTAS